MVVERPLRSRLHVSEEARLDAVRRYSVLETPTDGSFDRIARIAARAFEAPIATVTIVDEDRVWLRGRIGVDARDVSRGPGLCASAILTDELTVLTDTTLDPESLNNALVRDSLGIRFYAAAPIITRDGYRLGTVNVMDTNPRSVSAEQTEILRTLAVEVAENLELRLSARRAVELERQLLERALDDRRRAEKEADALIRRFLPPRLPEIRGLELATDYRPAARASVAGDFYDVFPIGECRWGVIIGDVSGKGGDAASTASIVKTSLRTALIAGHSCVEALEVLNDAMLLDQPAGDVSFCTCLCGILEMDRGAFRLMTANGGHPRPLVLRSDGRLDETGGGGILVGCFPNPTFEPSETVLQPGDAILFYTDGLTEARIGREMFGEERLRHVVRTNAGASARQVIDAVATELVRTAAQLHDDVALLSVSVDFSRHVEA